MTALESCALNAASASKDPKALRGYLWRGDAVSRGFASRLVSMTPSADAPTDSGSGPPASSKELSAVLGKIIDQLSLSAWMPGLALVGGLALLIVLRGSASDGFPDVGNAFEQLASLSLGGVLVLLVSVMLATVVAQAFEFEMIKLAEGYWGNGPLSRWLRGKRAAKHAKTLRSLRAQKKRLDKAAVKAAIPRMAPNDPDLTREIRSLWKARRAKANPAIAPSEAAIFLLEDWRRAARPGDLRAIEACEAAIRWYPSEYRLLPTKLGNALRSAEDRMKLADGGNLEGFVLRNYERIPARLLAQLTAFRTRLDMYCSLVLVCGSLAVVAVPLTFKFEAAYHATSTLCFVAFLTLTIVSYQAAVASARGYVSSLLACDEEVTRALLALSRQPSEQTGDPDTDPGT